MSIGIPGGREAEKRENDFNVGLQTNLATSRALGQDAAQTLSLESLPVSKNQPKSIWKRYGLS